MPYRTLSLEEFARYMGLELPEVRQLAQRGKLPGEKLGGQWRFNLGQVSDWFQQQMPNLPHDRLEALERALGQEADSPWGTAVVSELISATGIDLSLPARTKPSVLRELVALAECTGLVYDSQEIRKALYQREELCSTALPGGFAIPHPRRTLPYGTAEPVICLARTSAGLVFGGAGGELTDLFFLICSHDEKHHLHILARLVRMLDEQTLHDLRECQIEEQALEILIRREQQLVESR